MQSDRWKVDTIETREAFRDLRKEWNELLHDSRSDTFFLTWEWLYSWWENVAEDRPPAILTARDGNDRLVGIAPLIRGDALLPSLEFMGTGAVGSDYLDIIPRRQFEEPVLDAFAEHLRARNRPVAFHGVLSDGSAAADLVDRLDDGRWSAATEKINTCPFIDLSGHDWDSYLASLSSSHRYNFRRRCRKMKKDYEFSFDCASTQEDCNRALDILVQLHRKRWEERGGSDALHRPELVAFHHAVAERARRNGWLRLYVLRLDDRPAAALYGFRYGDRFLFYQSGFDPDFSKHSPSLVVLGLTVREAIEEGAREYDLLHGDERYKFHWASRQRDLCRLECHPPGLASSLVLQGRRISTASKSLAREVLPAPVTDALADLKERVS